MDKKEQDYAKSTFDDVCKRYDKIYFFKISATYVLEIIQKYNTCENIALLDVACGTGNVVLECASVLKKANFDGIDISQGMLEVAKQNGLNKKLKNVNFYKKDITLEKIDKKYDFITCSYALFFLPNPVEVLEEIYSSLNKNGYFIFTSFTANAFSPISNILLSLLKKYAKSSIEREEDEKWKDLENIEDIKYLCKQSNIQSLKVITKPIRYDMNLQEWWELLNDTGYRGMLMELDKKEYESLKVEFFEQANKHVDKQQNIELIADTHFCVIKKMKST